MSNHALKLKQINEDVYWGLTKQGLPNYSKDYLES